MPETGWGCTLVDHTGPGWLDWIEQKGDALVEAETGVDGRWRGGEEVEGDTHHLGLRWGEAAGLGGE